MKQESTVSITRKGEKEKRPFEIGWGMLPSCCQVDVKHRIMKDLFYTPAQFRKALKGERFINLYEIKNIEKAFGEIPPIGINPWTGRYILTESVIAEYKVA